MAKKDEPRSTGKSKMTVMIFQLEGSDDTLQEGLRKISEAAEKIIRPTSRVAPAILGPSDVVSHRIADEDNGAPESGDDLSEEDTDEGDETETAEVRRQRRVERTPNVVSLDQTKAKIQLTDYCTQKAAGETAYRRFMVLALWLKEQMGIADFSADHIYTCYKLIGWNDFPAHPMGMIRRITHDRYFEKGAGKGLYAINHVGETEVNRVPAKP